ncbi:uncharacterized protein N7529_000744 [Penicillium soppii]|jgi:hypothetical protein|uniref:uncharacterized protein n=1 Tax=Penicillium soppii TaxID=69789 RepID=UPI00254875D0|nr:uncharacterized protein N7529_000744 [Penicillium soppii]KAJ5882072.1 hypothetical protein N7529_000744 [Penicillium soppii]
MTSNRPFFSNFLAAFRAQSTYKPSAPAPQTLTTAQISQSARAIATKAANSQGPTHPTSTSPSTSSHHHQHHHTHSSTQATPAGPVQGPSQTQHYHAEQSQTSTSTSTPIPIRSPADRQRRGSDSSSGSGGFRDAIGPEKWYIGGRTPAGEERFYRLGMVTKGGGRLGGSGRVGSIDQLSL